MMRPYTEYQQSDISWLGKVPKHWTKNKFKFLLNEKTKTQNLELPCGSISFGHVVFKDSERLSEETKAAYQEVLSGEFLVNPLNLNYDLKSLRTALADINVIVSSGYIVLQSLGVVDKAYLRWLLYLFDLRHMKTLGAGIRQTISFKDIADCAVYIPNDSEQKAIATFLDHETQRIDSLIEEKQTFIKLLKEKRQALISHVVTKGLNPNVEMQDSGIEWIGQVPKHWEKCRVKQVSSFITSGPRGWSDFISDNGNAIFLQSGDLNNELGLNLAKAKKVSPPDGAEGQRTQLQLDDVVVCITGANTGRVALVKELDSTVYINQHLSLIRPIGEKVRSKYLAYFLSSEAGSRYYALEQYGLKEGLSLKNVAETPLMLPPVSEQTSIEKYLDKALATLSSLLTSVEESIHLLKERRTSLISEAVTGKIDVREAV
ncbi:restriction endonuclease subunit S [Citrobacter portucalensis]|uniref:restriction endonuclease subunit S n=1 Tax=Citrobacter portucalensis TaxID=1639133 RepID=UPI001C70A9A3|nr:restriction endonuclease subunit S [Citrobacter portucalensis]EKO3418858.1 restriction endonuclease subunit S [Vibrio fluvialis]ELG4658643.1 restriction endonuclease subunit S [Vibrio fluvialis]MBW9451220.1 restriction endonuclease subunit S [Citrobacter portucalensis]MBW9458203.1 restriction endonuclease subunit S [Citrobacter portucalensis]